MAWGFRPPAGPRSRSLRLSEQDPERAWEAGRSGRVGGGGADICLPASETALGDRAWPVKVDTVPLLPRPGGAVPGVGR